MPIYFQQGVRVVKGFGGLGVMGALPPQSGMVTNKGIITDIPSRIQGSGSLVVVNRPGDASGYFTLYASQLEVLDNYAATNYSWPSGTNHVLYGHSAQVAHVYAPTLGSGLIEYSANGVPTSTTR